MYLVQRALHHWWCLHNAVSPIWSGSSAEKAHIVSQLTFEEELEEEEAGEVVAMEEIAVAVEPVAEVAVDEDATMQDMPAVVPSDLKSSPMDRKRLGSDQDQDRKRLEPVLVAIGPQPPPVLVLPSHWNSFNWPKTG